MKTDTNNWKSLVIIQFALINEDISLSCVIIIDQIRLAILTFLEPKITQNSQSIWWSGQCDAAETTT